MVSQARIRAARLRRQAGLTLIEAAMVLALVALVIAGIMLFFQTASTTQKTTEAANQLASVQQAVRNLYAGQPTYTGLTEAAIITAMPSRMVVGTTLRHAFNGALSVLAANASGETDSGFSVTMTGVPAEACLKLATMDLGRSTVSLAIGGATAPAPRTPAVAQTQCGATNVAMTWLFF